MQAENGLLHRFLNVNGTAKMKYFVAVLGALLLPVNLYAADLLSLYQQARQSDPQIRAARANREAGQEARPQALSQLLPNLSLSGDVAYSDRDAHSAGQSDYTSDALVLSAVQPLFRKDRLVALEQADEQIKQADANLDAARQELILRVAQAYFAVLAAEDNLTFAQREKKAISRQLDQAQERFEVGLVAITDVHEAQARFDQARANEISARNLVDNALEALREIVPEADYNLDTLKDEVPLLAPEPQDMQQWSDTALQRNPSIISARLARNIARQEIQARQAGHYPTVDLVGTYSRSRGDEAFGSDVDLAKIAVQLAVPIYSGGGVNSATRQARFQYEAAQENLEAEYRAVGRQVRDAYRGIETSISSVKALKATELSARSALEATEAGFEAGTRTLVDVLNSQRDLYGAKRDYAKSRYDYVLNTLRLLQAAGTLTEEDVVRVNTWLQ